MGCPWSVAISLREALGNDRGLVGAALADVVGAGTQTASAKADPTEDITSPRGSDLCNPMQRATRAIATVLVKNPMQKVALADRAGPSQTFPRRTGEGIRAHARSSGALRLGASHQTYSLPIGINWAAPKHRQASVRRIFSNVISLGL